MRHDFLSSPVPLPLFLLLRSVPPRGQELQLRSPGVSGCEAKDRQGTEPQLAKGGQPRPTLDHRSLPLPLSRILPPPPPAARKTHRLTADDDDDDHRHGEVVPVESAINSPQSTPGHCCAKSRVTVNTYLGPGPTSSPHTHAHFFLYFALQAQALLSG